MKRYTASEIVRAALHWGEENITAMIDAHTTADGKIIETDYVAGLVELRKQMRAYRRKRFS